MAIFYFLTACHEIKFNELYSILSILHFVSELLLLFFST